MFYCKDLKSLVVLSLYEGELLGIVNKLFFDKMSTDNQLNIQPLQSYPIFETFSPSLQRIPSHKWLVKYFELSNINGEWNEGQTGFVYLDNTLPSQPPPLLIMTKENMET